MALAANALLTLAELKDYGALGSGSVRDTALEGIINRISDEIEKFCGRTFVSSGSDLTEYHTFATDTSEVCTPVLRTLEAPIISVTSVHEDPAWPPTYGAGSLLVADTDYLVVKPEGIIRRLLAGGDRAWYSGRRAVRVVYKGGYASAATVPGHVKAVALRYAATIWKETERGQFGVSSASDAMGNFTRFGAARLTPDMQEVLLAELRSTFWRSGERDA